MTRRGDTFPRPSEVVPRRFTSRCEVRLAFAILMDAVACLAERSDAGRVPPRLFRWEAEQWIESGDQGPLFSFERVCLILLLDPEDVRARLRHWRRQRPPVDPERVRAELGCAMEA